jgi:predicted nucleic acid-binding protein
MKSEQGVATMWRRRPFRAATWATRVDPGSSPEAIAAWNLGAGESAVLTAARAMPGTHAIVDDREARRCAAALGVPAFGTIGVVLRAKRLGAVPAARPLLERLAAVGMYVTPELIDAASVLVGE